MIKALSEYNKVSQDYCSAYTVLSFSAWACKASLQYLLNCFFCFLNWQENFKWFMFCHPFFPIIFSSQARIHVYHLLVLTHSPFTKSALWYQLTILDVFTLHQSCLLVSLVHLLSLRSILGIQPVSKNPPHILCPYLCSCSILQLASWHSSRSLPLFPSVNPSPHCVHCKLPSPAPPPLSPLPSTLFSSSSLNQLSTPPPCLYLNDEAVVGLGEKWRVVVDIRDVDVDHGAAGEGGHPIVWGYHRQGVPWSLRRRKKKKLLLYPIM